MCRILELTFDPLFCRPNAKIFALMQCEQRLFLRSILYRQHTCTCNINTYHNCRCCQSIFGRYNLWNEIIQHTRYSRTQTKYTRNTLDCDQSNYSSRIVFSHIPIEFGPTRNSAIRSADPENPTIVSNMKWIGWPVAEISPFEIFPKKRSVGPQYILLLTLRPVGVPGPL